MKILYSTLMVNGLGQTFRGKENPLAIVSHEIEAIKCGSKKYRVYKIYADQRASRAPDTKRLIRYKITSLWGGESSRDGGLG